MVPNLVEIAFLQTTFLVFPFISQNLNKIFRLILHLYAHELFYPILLSRFASSIAVNFYFYDPRSEWQFFLDPISSHDDTKFWFSVQNHDFLQVHTYSSSRIPARTGLNITMGLPPGIISNIHKRVLWVKLWRYFLKISKLVH